MNLEFEIAKRLHFDRRGKRTISRPAVRIATVGIALGLVVMMLSVSIVLGFKHTIRDKVIDFGSHIQITNYDNNSSFETKPISVTPALKQALLDIDHVQSVNAFATKPGILKTDENVQGIILKGIDNLGDTISDPQGSIVSQYLADLMDLQVGDSYLAYFVNEDGIRGRKFHVSDIYCTHFEEHDKKFILCQLDQVRRLNDWDSTQASGFEIRLDQYDALQPTADRIYALVANRLQPDGSALLPLTVEQLNPQVFAWLDMLDVNVWIILTLMILVAGFNVISGLLILILERTTMIGLLKALGAQDWSIRKIFLFQASLLIGKGMLLGDIIALTVIVTQSLTHVIPLDAATYYVDFVPMEFNLLAFLLINVGTFLIALLMLLLPSYIIAKISPAKTIRFE